MNSAATHVFRDSDFECLKPKVAAAWSVLSTRWTGKVSEDEKDFLFAYYVLGLTTAFLEQASPQRHLDVYRDLVGSVLVPARAERVLNSLPESAAPRIEIAFRTMENIGHKDGTSLHAARFSTNIETQSYPANGRENL